MRPSSTRSVLALGAVLSGCVSTSVAPPDLGPGTCVLDNRFPGTWKSTRSSQVGPASVSFTFGCDCSYESRSRVLLMSLREQGSYWADDGQLSFSRASGQVTTWSFRFEGDRLILQEGGNEAHSYERTKPRQCAPPPPS